MGCSCGKKKNACGMTPEVVEITNKECPVLFHKTTIQAARGDDSVGSPVAPSNGDYRNMLVEYEANGHLYIYSSDGIYTRVDNDAKVFNELIGRPKYDGKPMTSDTDIPSVEKLREDMTASDEALADAISLEARERREADNSLSARINSKQNKLTAGDNITISGDTISASVPTVNDATLTIQKNGTNVETFTANSSTNKTANITVPTKTSDLTNDGADGTSAYVEADDLSTVATTGSYSDLTNKPTIDGSFSTTSENAVQNKVITNALDRGVMTNLAIDPNASTTVVELDSTKTNLKTGTTATDNIPLPVASTTQAGVMNSAMYNALTKNTQDIANIIGEVVAITGLPASPTQSELATAWLNASGESALINGAGIYDVTNAKRWTYYANDTTWHALDASGSVTVNQWTNSSAGIVKGSTNTGQIFAESDGTGSVNGWDTLNSTVADHTSKLATIAQGAEVNVQSDWTEANSSSDAFILNKPQNLVQDANYVHTDNNFTTAEKNQIATNTTDIAGKQDTLVSGTNIKTVDSQSLLGSGNIPVGDVYVDDVLSQPTNIDYVDTANIKNSAVTSAKIAAEAVTTTKIADDAVTSDKVDFTTFLLTHKSGYINTTTSTTSTLDLSFLNTDITTPAGTSILVTLTAPIKTTSNNASIVLYVDGVSKGMLVTTHLTNSYPTTGMLRVDNLSAGVHELRFKLSASNSTATFETYTSYALRVEQCPPGSS